MLVATVDTATLTLSCALVELDADDVRLLAERTETQPSGKPPPPRSKDDAHPPSGPIRTVGHSGRLPVALVELLEMTEHKLPEIEGYAIGLGPGSFTGLRIGLATWKGLAYANRRPIVGTSSLQAMALEAASRAPRGSLLVPLLDARKGEIYAGFYRSSANGELEALAPEAALSAEALVERLASMEPALVFGEGYHAYRERLGSLAHLPEGPMSPSALGVARLAAPRLRGASYDAQRLFALEPHYVRASEAEMKFPHGLGPGASKG